MMYVLKTYSTEEVIDIVDKLTMGYYTAIGVIFAIVGAVLIFAVWDRSTMKKAIQKEFEAKLEKETEKIKQEMQTKVDELIENAEKTFEDKLEKETDKVKQEIQTKIDELLEKANKTVQENLTQETDKVKLDIQTKVDELVRNSEDKLQKLTIDNQHYISEIILKFDSVSHPDKLSLVKRNAIDFFLKKRESIFSDKYLKLYKENIQQEVALLEQNLPVSFTEMDNGNFKNFKGELVFYGINDPSKIEQNANED